LTRCQQQLAELFYEGVKKKKENEYYRCRCNRQIEFEEMHLKTTIQVSYAKKVIFMANNLF